MPITDKDRELAKKLLNHITMNSWDYNCPDHKHDENTVIELLAQHRESQWQDIDTAPKDGTPIYMWNKETGIVGKGCFESSPCSETFDEHQGMSCYNKVTFYYKAGFISDYHTYHAGIEKPDSKYEYKEKITPNLPTHWCPANTPTPPTEEK